MYENTHAFYEKLQRSKNALLVKDDVGKPKQCTRNLPSGDHAYGVKPTPDAEGAGALLSSWSVHSAPKARPNERDFRKLNIMSVGKQCITPKQVNEFRKQADVRLKPGRNSTVGPMSPSKDAYYGYPTKPGTPISNVIQHSYGNQAMVENHEFYLQNLRNKPQKKSVNIPFSLRKQQDSQGSLVKKQFKMKRFEKVKPKVTIKKE